MIGKQYLFNSFSIIMPKSNQIKYGLTSGSSSDDDIRDVPDSTYVTLAGPPKRSQKDTYVD